MIYLVIWGSFSALNLSLYLLAHGLNEQGTMARLVIFGPIGTLMSMFV